MYFHLPVVADPLLHHSAAMNEIHGTLVTGCLLILLLDQQIDRPEENNNTPRIHNNINVPCCCLYKQNFEDFYT